jgi:hypothetical protein
LGLQRDEVTEEWRELQTEGLNDLYFFTIIYLGDKIKKNKMGGTCST